MVRTAGHDRRGADPCPRGRLDRVREGRGAFPGLGSPSRSRGLRVLDLARKKARGVAFSIPWITSPTYCSGSARPGGALWCRDREAGSRVRIVSEGRYRGHGARGAQGWRPLPSLSISGGAWKATTKGKEQSGTLPAEARSAIGKAGLPLRAPFGEQTAGQIADAFRYLSAKLHAKGELRARYSVHDLRHAYAVRLYQGTRDVYAVKTALGHSNVTVTEKYLRSLGL